MKLKLHHIGLVVPEIARFAAGLRILGTGDATQPEPDPIQKVAASFIAIGCEQDVYIEILEPTAATSPITNFLGERGGGLHHLCFAVDDIDEAGHKLVSQGFRMVCAPADCVGYDRNFKRASSKPTRIAFYLLANKILIELLQEGMAAGCINSGAHKQ